MNDSSVSTANGTDVYLPLAQQSFPFRRIFYPLGFPVAIETNAPELLLAAEESWGERSPASFAPPLHLQIGVSAFDSPECPPAPAVRAHGHLLSFIADAENFVVCDLREGCAFGWISRAALYYRAYLRYHILEAVALSLICSAHVTPVHAACVSFAGRGLLLCGDSGAGKSTLAYACARAGWTYTSDDASYVLRDTHAVSVRGNAHQFRFRPSARDLFPELRNRSITPRAEGKPSIEIPATELPAIRGTDETEVDAIVLLHRHSSPSVDLVPLTREQVLPFFGLSVHAPAGTEQQHANAVKRLLQLPAYELRYRDLVPAINRLELLARETRRRPSCLASDSTSISAADPVNFPYG